MKKGVVFDMDGVLIDSEPYNEKELDEFCKRYDLPIHPTGFFIGTNDKYFWECKVPNDPERAEMLKKELVKFRRDREKPYTELIDEEVYPTFKKLKENGMKIAIASSSPIEEIEEVIKFANIGNFVDFYISGRSCKNHKPDPEIYFTALEALGITSEEAIVVEDSTPGIQAAKNANLFVCGRIPKTAGYELDQSKANVRISSLSQIFEYLK